MSPTLPPAEARDRDAEEAKAKELARLMALKIVVIVLGVILVAMALVVFSTLIIRAVKGRGADVPPTATVAAPSAAPAVAPATVPPGAALPPGTPMPAGARVVSSALGDGRLALTLEQDGRLTIILFDAATLRELGRTTLSPAAAPRP